MKFLSGTCREVTRLLLEREERPLGWAERLRVRMHLRICDMCLRFTRQQALMAQAMGRWRAYRDEDR